MHISRLLFAEQLSYFVFLCVIKSRFIPFALLLINHDNIICLAYPLLWLFLSVSLCNNTAICSNPAIDTGVLRLCEAPFHLSFDSVPPRRYTHCFF